MQKEINRMQVRLFRAAWKKWGLTLEKCADLFDMYDLDSYIADAYEFFHVQGDEANLEEIENHLKLKGVNL